MNLTEMVYQQLMDLLIGGELLPGEVITERNLAERLNASRTPIREALSRLEADGLVYKQAGRGVTVSPFSAEAFIDILDVRKVLEAEAARLAAGRIPPDALLRVRQSLEDVATKPSPTLAEIWSADDLLHGEIAKASGNRLLVKMIRDLRRRTHVFNAFRNPSGTAFTLDQNNHLLNAIESGDGERAKQAMETHILLVKNAIIDKLSGARR